MAKRLAPKQKEELLKLFALGKSVDDLSKKFNFSKSTISRNLKNNLGQKKYKELIIKSKSTNIKQVEIENIKSDKKDKTINEKNLHEDYREKMSTESQFVEIAPLNCEIDNSLQKDLSSVPISDVTFPKTIYMIVHKGVELEIKYLKDYPKWQFLSEDELKRKSIEIYSESKTAKNFCGKEQKVIKVPNTDVFRIVAPILLSRGISRIISSDTLIAL